MLREMEYLSEDVSTLTQMTDMVSMLHCPHSHLEDSIKDMLNALNKQLSERQASDTQLCYLELNLHTRYEREFGAMPWRNQDFFKGVSTNSSRFTRFFSLEKSITLEFQMITFFNLSYYYLIQT